MATWFGNADGSAGVTGHSAGSIRGQSFAAPISGNVDQARGMIGWNGPSVDAKVKCLIYAVSGGNPAALLATSSEVTIPVSSSASMRTFTFGTPLAVTASTSYFLMLFVGDAGITVQYRHAGSRYLTSGLSYPTAPNPFGTPTIAGDEQYYLEAGIADAAAAFVPKITIVG